MPLGMGTVLDQILLWDRHQLAGAGPGWWIDREFHGDWAHAGRGGRRSPNLDSG
jgi:hypothetical protein